MTAREAAPSPGAGGAQPARTSLRLAVHPMSSADIPALVALEARIFGTPWDAQAFRAFLHPGPPFSWLALAGAELAGYALGWCASGESELMNLAVAPEWRRRGVGERLLRRAMVHCADGGARRMSLEVRASNAAAQGLYARHGFVEVARRRAYYSRPREDAIVLRARLDRATDAGAHPI